MMKNILMPILFVLVYSLPAIAQTNANPVKQYTVIASSKMDTAKLLYGKYGCTASKYRNGSYEYLTRGSFTISKNNKYVYNGFEQPSGGSFVVDKPGNILFKGGYLDGGKAEKIDRPNKFFLTFPSNPDNRWTCGWVE